MEEKIIIVVIGGAPHKFNIYDLAGLDKVRERGIIANMSISLIEDSMTELAEKFNNLSKAFEMHPVLVEDFEKLHVREMKKKPWKKKYFYE